MSIIQISKIQQRSGNIVDLPQLDEAEFGWATDAKRLFIGKTTPNENIEVLTSYSNINFSQITGSYGNMDIDVANLAAGQVMAYDGTNWTNRGVGVGGTISLGNVANVRIDGGGIGYVLSTDGTGNLSWTPKGTLYTDIYNLVNDVSGNVITMTVANTTPYVNSQAITVSGAVISNSGANGNVNGHTFYVKLAGDYASSGNVTLYTDAGLITTANGAGLTSYTANTGVATAVVMGGGGGTSSAGGANTSIQYNNNNLLDGDASFTWDFASKILTVGGNANVTYLNASSTVVAQTLVSNIATGTAPLTVTSTTRVSNLSVSYSNVSDYEVITTQNSGTFYPVFVNGSSTGNYALGSNSNIALNAATGNLSVTILNANGNITGANINTGGLVTATGNITGANLVTGGLVSAGGNIIGANILSGGLISVTGNITSANILTGNVSASGNITG